MHDLNTCNYSVLSSTELPESKYDGGHHLTRSQKNDLNSSFFGQTGNCSKETTKLTRESQQFNLDVAIKHSVPVNKTPADLQVSGDQVTPFNLTYVLKGNQVPGGMSGGPMSMVCANTKKQAPEL